MRRFWLLRDEDETGISGAGCVAEGARFSDGSMVMRWRTEHTSTAFYKDEETLLAIHGHEGRTRIVWVDPTYGQARPENVACDHARVQIAKGDEVLPVRLMQLEKKSYVVVEEPQWNGSEWRVSSVGWPEHGYGLANCAGEELVVVTHPDRRPRSAESRA